MGGARRQLLPQQPKVFYPRLWRRLHYPLTIASPASRDVHRQHLQLAKSYGFGYVRHHTHCEVPEFYDAADEVGIMVQPEMPYYGSTPSAACRGLLQAARKT